MINILILNWNSSNDVNNLLHSLEKSIYKNFRIILIHNASEDELAIRSIYVEYKEKFKIDLIINEENYGYAGGNNRGYEFLIKNNYDGDILILNPDVIVRPNTINELISAKTEGVGAVMIRTFDEGGNHIYDALSLSNFNQKLVKTNDAICDTDYSAGSCFLLDRNVIDEIGLFDEYYFMYWEEVDLSIRMKQAGYKLVSTTLSCVIRKSNPVYRSPNAIFYSVRNSFYIKRKYNKLFNNHFLYLLNIFLYSIKSSFLVAGFHPIIAFVKGVISGCVRGN